MENPFSNDLSNQEGERFSNQEGEWRAIIMSLVAGLSTGLGGCAVLFVNTVSNKVMAFTLSLAAGVMTSVSLLELMKPILSGSIIPLLWSFIGVIFYALLRSLLPENHTIAASTGHKRGEDNEPPDQLRHREWRLGILMMMTLTAHNLPEGVAVAVGALKSKRTGLVVMSAIAMHNIPEGLAIAIPIYAATGNRMKALAMTLASGLSEPLGAGLGILVLRPFLSQDLVDHATCAVGGVMLAVSFLDLAPEALKYRELTASIAGLFTGWFAILATMRYA